MKKKKPTKLNTTSISVKNAYKSFKKAVSKSNTAKNKQICLENKQSSFREIQFLSVNIAFFNAIREKTALRQRIKDFQLESREKTIKYFKTQLISAFKAIQIKQTTAKTVEIMQESIQESRRADVLREIIALCKEKVKRRLQNRRIVLK